MMIGGTVIIRSAPARALLGAIGPSLTNFVVPNALGDPTLELHDGNGALIASNDNWRNDQEAPILEAFYARFARRLFDYRNVSDDLNTPWALWEM